MIYAGHNISEDYLFELTEYLKDKKFRCYQYLQIGNYYRNCACPSAC